jgi:hypothetical protein
MKPQKRDGETAIEKKYFHSYPTVNIRLSNVMELFNEMKGVLLEKMCDFTQRGSGWRLDSICNLGIHTIKYVPASGKSYIPLPTKLSNTKAL